MSVDIVRAWKDEQYRMSLSASEQAQLLRNPAGSVELTNADLEGVAGGKLGGDLSIGKTTCGYISMVATACCLPSESGQP